MLNWRNTWCSISSRLSPALYRKWRFSEFRALKWAQLPSIKEQEPELLLLPEFLEYPGKFLDIGANNGVYLYAALNKKPVGDLIGIEPIPRLYRLLKRAFPNLAIHQLALTDSQGPKWLKIPDIKGHAFPTRATLNVDHKDPGETGQELIQVSTMTLDGFWQSIGNPDLGCIKIDTEGHEGAVLKGAVETLKQHRPLLLVEIEQRHHHEDIAKIFTLVTDLGYACYYFDPSGPKLREIVGSSQTVMNAQGIDARYLNNFFFLPKDRPALFTLLDKINQKISSLGKAA